MNFTPYLNFDGRCEEAFRFYERLFGGRIEFMQSFGDSPMAGHVAEEHRNQIMHATLKIGDRLLMGSDAPGGRYERPQGVYVSIGGIDKATGKRIFDALAEGGTVAMPYEETFWSPGFGMVVDRFGIPWMLNAEPA